MAEVLIEFENRLSAGDAEYEARVCGRQREDGLWEGWIEFAPLGPGAAALRSGRETTQPSRDLLVYWARGLTIGYLDGALKRVLHPTAPPIHREVSRAKPAFEGPADHGARSDTRSVPPARAVLDPFAVYAEGDTVLSGQLHALDEGQLRNIVRAYGLAGGRPEAVDVMTHEELRAHIMAEVKARAG